MVLSLLPSTSVSPPWFVRTADLVWLSRKVGGCMVRSKGPLGIHGHYVQFKLFSKGPFYSPVSVQIPVGPGSYLLKRATSKILFYISSEGKYTRGFETSITMKVRGKAGFGLRGLLLSVFLSFLPPAVPWERKCLKKT